VSRIVAFKVKNIDNKILFACLVGGLDYSTDTPEALCGTQGLRDIPVETKLKRLLHKH